MFDPSFHKLLLRYVIKIHVHKIKVKLCKAVIFCMLVTYTATGLDKSRTCIREVLKIMNFTNYRNLLFFNKYAHEHNTLFQFTEYVKELYEIRHAVL